MSHKRINTIKFILIVLIVYAILASNIFGIGQKLVPQNKDYVNQPDITISTTGDTTTQTGHFAAPTTQDQLDTLCTTVRICDTIDFQGKFSVIEKYNYTKMLSNIIKFIDTHTTYDKSIIPTIKSIAISKKYEETRGYVQQNKIIFYIQLIQSNNEFSELATHEIGHITDLGYLQGSSDKKSKVYTEFDKIVFAINDPSLYFYKISWTSETIRKAASKTKDFCSIYGMTDPFEDFAECFNLYIHHNTLFKQLARTNTSLKQKYNLIANIFDGNFINANTKDLLLIKQNTMRRPRDTTKIN